MKFLRVCEDTLPYQLLRAPFDAEKRMESRVKELIIWTAWLKVCLKASGKNPSPNFNHRDIAN